MYQDGNNYSSIGKIFNLQYRTIKKYLTVSQEELEKKKNKTIVDERTKKKQDLINQVRKLYKKGLSKQAIARECKIAFRTINSYLNENACSKRKVSRERSNNFLKFKIEIINLLNKNIKKQEIYKILRDKGYRYALRTFYVHVSIIVKENKSDSNISLETSTIKIKLNKVVSLLYKPINKISDFSNELYNKIIEKYPLILKILSLVNQFKESIQDKDLNKFHIWLERAAELNIKELNSFLSGIKRDKEAVENAIIYRFTNGLAEGSVNKLKTLKRTMYGKASFETLKRKLLWHEKNR